ncbi:MAG: small multi-drug export protein [Peptostreptococcaceae bacterium]|nr:small multi-drug export protein [Peptostreptococcaceae bacterium]
MDITSGLSKELFVLILSATPFIELRGAIPLGIGFAMNPWKVYLLSVLGSSLPAPFLILFFRRSLEFLEEKRYFPRFTGFLHRHIHKKSKKLKAFSLLGLFCFVALPLPSTGAYTGSALASILNIRLKYSFPVILLGNMTAGLLVMILSHILF